MRKWPQQGTIIEECDDWHSDSWWVQGGLATPTSTARRNPRSESRFTAWLTELRFYVPQITVVSLRPMYNGGDGERLNYFCTLHLVPSSLYHTQLPPTEGHYDFILFELSVKYNDVGPNAARRPGSSATADTCCISSEVLRKYSNCILRVIIS